MKILKESKENLPVAFLTSFVSDGWEKVGILKEEIEAIKKEFKGTKKVEELIQDLIDAYLVCIGQMEQHLAAKDYLDIDEKEEVKESLTEGLHDKEAEDIKRSVLDDIRKYPEHFSKEEYYYQIGAEMASRGFPFLPNYFLLDNVGEGDKEYEDIKRGYLDNGGKLTEDLADAPEKVEKINDGEKVELHTELPDYDVEVEQKGNKVEVEVEPKFDEDEWPEPDMSDNKDIEDARTALRTGELKLGKPIILNDKKEDEIRSEMPVPEFVKDEIEQAEDEEIHEKPQDVDDFLFDDFPEPDLAHKITDKDLYED